jgi:uncharacterized protein (DUF2249 family)
MSCLAHGTLEPNLRGAFSVINLNTGEYVWKIPLGEYPELAAKG